MDKHNLKHQRNGLGLSQQTKAVVQELIAKYVNGDTPALDRNQLRDLLLQIVGLTGSGGSGGGDIDVTAPISGDGSSGDPLALNALGVTSGFIGPSAVINSKIADGAVTGPKIAAMGASTNLFVVGWDAAASQWKGKNLIAGTNVTLTATDDSVTVAASGGGGGGSNTYYNAGNGCFVSADGAGITYTKSAGVGTITIPASVNMYNFRIVGAAGDLSSGEIAVTIIDGNTGGAYNTSDANSRYPMVTLDNRTVILPTDPFLQRPDDAADSVNIFKERFTTATRVTFKVTGLSGDFGIAGVY